MRSIHSRQTGGYIRVMKNPDDGATALMEPPVFLTTSAVSRILGVSPNTVTRWARDGRLACQVTLGGHHRFVREVIEELRQSLNHAASAGRR